MTKKIRIAIDGFAGTGKGTTAKGVAEKLGYTYVDTGAMYRALTLYLLNNSITHTDHEKIRKCLPNVKISFDYNPTTHHNDVLLNGENVEAHIRSLAVQEHVALVANIPFVRERMVKQQQELCKHGGVVMDGRDIGSVVMPDAELKVFLTCDVNVRAQRRQRELAARGEVVDIETIKQNLIARDSIDRQRTDVLFEKYRHEVKVLDTTHLTIQEQVEIVVKRAQETINQKRT